MKDCNEKNSETLNLISFIICKLVGRNKCGEYYADDGVEITEQESN